MNYSYVFCLSVGLWIKFKPRFTRVSCLASACLSDILISYETFYICGQNCKRNIQPLGQILVYHSLFQFLTKKNKKISVAIQEKKDCFEGGCWHFTLKTSDVKITCFMALNCHATAKSISIYASFTKRKCNRLYVVIKFYCCCEKLKAETINPRHQQEHVPPESLIMANSKM